MLKNRILPIGVLLFVCGTAITVFSDGVVLPLCFAALTVSCTLLCAIRFLRLRTSLILGLLPLAAFLYVNLYSFLFIPHQSVTGSAYVRVTSETDYYSGRQLTAVVTSSDSLKSGAGVTFYSPPDESITFGDIVYLQGRFNCLDRSPSRLASGTYYAFSGNSYFIDKDNGFFVNLRRTLIKNCDKAFGEYSPVIKAITISDRSGITSSDYHKYSRSGASHILAVSGLHLTIAVMALYSLIRKAVGNKYVVCASGCLLVFVFWAVSAFPVSSVRAGIMLCLMFIANMISERRDSFTSLFASVFFILLLNPFEVSSLSLQLSFLATLGIISVSGASASVRKPTSGIFKFLYEYAAVPIRFTLSSLVFTFPVTLTSFGTVSIVSPLSSVVISLIFPFYLTFSYIFCFLSLAFPHAANAVSNAAVFFAQIFEKVIDFLSSFRYSSVTPGSGTGIFLIILSLVCIAAMLVIKKKRFAFVFYATVCIMTVSVALHIFFTSFSGSKVCFYNDEYGYAVIAVSNGECVYIDDGNCRNYDSLITKSGKTYCDKAVFRTIDESAVSKAEFFIDCMGTKTVYLLEDESEDNLLYYDAISDLADKRSCEIIYKPSFSLNSGEISLVITRDATEIGYDKCYICIIDGNIEKDIAANETLIVPASNSELKETYGNAYTYPAGSFTKLTE